MKIKLYFGRFESISQSGIGRAMIHQKKALELNNIEYTTDIECEDYDILHINTVFPEGYSDILKAKKNNKKIIYHAHSTEEDFRDSFMFSNTVSGIFKKWLIFLYSKADYVLTPTPYSKKLLEEGYDITAPIQAISNGIELSKYVCTQEQISEFNKKFSIESDQKVIISVGWLFERKGFDTFIEIAKLLPEYKFIWFGDIKKSKPTIKIQKMLNDLPSNVILPGYVSGEMIKGAYGRCDLFFFPSREETEGIVVLEALASKCNILVRDIPVFSSWLEDGVNCYKGNSNDEFVLRIKQIISNEVPSLINEGFKVVEERQLSIIGRELLDIYNKVLNI